MKQVTLEDNIQVLHFRVGSVRLCMGLKNITKTIMLVELEIVPESPSFLAGLMNFAGKIIPVIDLCLYLDLPRKQPYSIDIPVMICTNQVKEVAFIVDEIVEISTVLPNEIKMKEVFKDQESPFLAVIEHNDYHSLLLNIDKILNENLLDKNYLSKIDKKIIDNVS